MSDPELVNDLNTLLHILEKLNEEEIPPICVDENGIYYPTAIEGKKEEINKLDDVLHKLLGIDDYIPIVAVGGVTPEGNKYVCIIRTWGE